MPEFSVSTNYPKRVLCEKTEKLDEAVIFLNNYVCYKIFYPSVYFYCRGCILVGSCLFRTLNHSLAQSMMYCTLHGCSSMSLRNSNSSPLIIAGSEFAAYS